MSVIIDKKNKEILNSIFTTTEKKDWFLSFIRKFFRETITPSDSNIASFLYGRETVITDLENLFKENE